MRAISHILFNMLALWMFGVELERMWGTRTSRSTTSSCRGRRRPRPWYCSCICRCHSPISSYYPSTSARRAPSTASCSPSRSTSRTRPILMFFVFPVPGEILRHDHRRAWPCSSSARRRSGVAHTAHLGGLLSGYLYLKGQAAQRRLGDPVPLPEVEDQPHAAEVRRLLRRPMRDDVRPSSPLSPRPPGGAPCRIIARQYLRSAGQIAASNVSPRCCRSQDRDGANAGGDCPGRTFKRAAARSHPLPRELNRCTSMCSRARYRLSRRRRRGDRPGGRGPAHPRAHAASGGGARRHVRIGRVQSSPAGLGRHRGSTRNRTVNDSPVAGGSKPTARRP